MTDKLTDKQHAEKMRQIADLLDELWDDMRLPIAKTGARDWRTVADELDPPLDPLAGLDSHQWVEMEHPNGARLAMSARSARVAYSHWTLIRVIPDGDARDVLVIPVEEAREASQAFRESCECLIDAALAEHEARWSS